MTRQEIIEKVKEVEKAPSCCAELKDACGKFLAAVDTADEKAAAKNLVAELEADVMPIEAVENFFKSAAGIEKVGAELAGNLSAHAKEVREKGGKFCDCPACASGKAILDNKDVIL